MSTPEAVTIDANTVVSHEQDGRVLSGVGVTADHLAETMDRHAPDAPAEKPTQAAAPVVEQPAKPQTRGQKRFSDLTQAAKDAITRAETAERERDKLRAKVTQPAPQAPAVQPQTSPSQQHIAAARATRPQPKEDEIGTKYSSYADFVLDSARWAVEDSQSNIETQIRASIEADRASRTFLDTVERTRAAGRKVYADFDAVLTAGAGSQIPLGKTLDEAMERAQYVIHHPQSEHLQYAIMKDGALAQRLAQMGAIDFGLELAKIAPTAPAVSPASTGASGSVIAPAPYQPVGSGTKTTVASSAEHAKAGNYRAYKAQRAAERAAKNRRP